MPDQPRKKKQYPPSIPAATLWSAEHYPLAKRRMPVAPLIRLSGIDHLPQPPPHHEPRRRPQTPPPAYTGSLPPRYEEVAYYSDDDEPLAFLQQRRVDSVEDDESADDHETLDQLQQRLSASSV
ncbi:hypothetical protein BJV82DRAFT_665714 [Fennellomyces sp. T-0311]|nr:hypothetical protein BJV82DRAFT_665714 [Fennellomyces sp. T-0311]